MEDRPMLKRGEERSFMLEPDFTRRRQFRCSADFWGCASQDKRLRSTGRCVIRKVKEGRPLEDLLRILVEVWNFGRGCDIGTMLA